VWTTAAGLGNPRGNHTATLLANGKVLVAGGLGTTGELATAELYNPATDTWSFTGSLASARHDHTATPLANGKVLVAGGEKNGQSLDTAELYDPNTGSWSSAASLISKRLLHTATLLQNGKVLITEGDGIGTSHSAELYDPTMNTWTSAASLATGRVFHSATLLPNGKVLVAGGLPDNNTIGSYDAELYNPLNNTWTSAGGPFSLRVYRTSTLLGNGKVLIAGGRDDYRNIVLRDADLYDPATNMWSRTEFLGAAHSVDTATLLQNGSVLVIGTDDAGTFLSEIYDPVTSSWTGPATLHAKRESHTATLLPNGKVLAAGGYIYNSSTGTESFIATSELYEPTVSTASGGPRIVFGTNRHLGNHDIYSMELDGSDETRLTTSPAYDDQPKWSPDSSKIAFISDRDGNFEIYTMDPSGGSQTRITNNFAADGFPAWSPDGTKLAFVRGDLRNPSTFEIYVMNANGSNQTRLTNDGAIDGVPAWSPDGTKIVFMSGGSSVFDPNSFEIYTMNATDGSNRTRLTNNTIADGQPSYSPDGTKILFASGDALNPNGIEIFVMNTNGTGRVQLTRNNVTDGFPAWSFDGSSIVFAAGSVNDEKSVELFMMNANGTHPAKLTTNTDLDWFPDWQRIATPPSQIQFTSPTYDVNEGSGGYFIIANRTGNTTGMAAVNYSTSDTAGANNCNVVGFAASSRCDYEATSGTLNFAPGETSKIITVFRVDDAYVENNETFSVTLSNAVGSGVSLGSPATTIVTIIDNDSAAAANPIDQPGFFVFQQYLDFLNREPDINGFDFWTNQITSCGSDAQCTEIRRINVSAAFFLSIEFQETGYLVERLYKTAYGNASGVSTIGGTHQLVVPIVRLNEFLPDTQQIGQGVVVGVGNWQAQLENNKQTLITEFVQRARFLTAYPASLTPAQFVDMLNANAGGPLSPAERNQLVSDLTGGAKTRAQVLRAVAEDPDLVAAERNRAFVLAQYFGYLRRNPNDAPDSDYTGYDNWLGKLNQFNGNFVQAEMVKAFITSIEYRQRFGPN
jgi:Tol biopolymer transport system component/N-acetylneuraminic acid mutarotase